MHQATPLLIIDDDKDLCDLLVDFLGREGFAPVAAPSVEEGVRLALDGTFRLVVLDVMLPGTDGFEVLRRIRRTSTLPVVMLTARGDESDRISGLEIGADDYVPKPFNPRELIARLRAVLRRSTAQEHLVSDRKKASIGDLVLDATRHVAECAGHEIALTETECSLLDLLVRRTGQPVTREFLCRAVLGRALFPEDRAVDVHMSNIRKKLAVCGDVERIRTIRGTGYMYVPPFLATPATADEPHQGG
jgi:two-component system response regulator CpxR